MNQNKRTFLYNFKAIILLSIPIFITLIKLSGHDLLVAEEMFPANIKILVLITGMLAGLVYFIIKYARFHIMTNSIRGGQDFPDVFPIIEKLCKKLRIDVPEVGFLESSNPNAFVYKRNNKPVMVLTIPLIEILDTRELETVLAHELTHIKNKDLELRKYSLLVRFALFINPLVHFIEPFISRSREYLADETAAWITGAPDKLASSLLKVEDYKNSYHKNTISTSMPPDIFYFECNSCVPYIFSRCPSTENRIKRLMSLKLLSQ